MDGNRDNRANSAQLGWDLTELGNIDFGLDKFNSYGKKYFLLTRNLCLITIKSFPVKHISDDRSSSILLKPKLNYSWV